jgi:hypothetical protein
MKKIGKDVERRREKKVVDSYFDRGSSNDLGVYLYVYQELSKKINLRIIK